MGFLLMGLFISLFLAGFISPGIAQNHYTVFHYHPNDYQGDNQNWDICKDAKGRVFIANNAGLLVYDGAQSRLFELPQKSILRSVNCIDNKVYTGSFEEFGYWEEKDNFAWQYHSLVSLVDPEIFQNDEFWKIVELNGMIYFQSFGNILMYDGNKVEVLEIPGSVLFLLKTTDRIFVQQINGALYELIGNSLHLMPNGGIFTDTEVKTIIQTNQNEFVIGTSSKGLFTYSDGNISAWETDISGELEEYTINNGIALGGHLVFGTILKGVFIIDTNGRLIHHLHSANALQNNTTLAVYGDEEDNLWVGLDKGFDYVWLHSPVESFKDPGLGLGTVYTAALYENELYIGTNQGIYYYKLDKSGKIIDPEFIDQSQGQVWFLKVLDGKLYCGLNDGTYLIDNHQLVKVGEMNGGYNLKKSIFNNQEIVLQSTYNEIVVYEKSDAVYKQIRTLHGFTAPARFLEVDHLDNILLGHSISGLYLLRPSADLDSIIQYTKLGPEHGLHFNANKVFMVDNRIIVPSGEQMYQWDAINQVLLPYDELNRQIESFVSATNIISAGANKYWFIKKNEIALFEIRFEKVKLLYRFIPDMFDFEMVNGFENMVELKNNLFLICLEEGYALIDLMRLNQLTEINKSPQISEIGFYKQNSLQKRSFQPETKSMYKLNHAFNSLTVIFTSNEIVGRKKYFQHRLQGIENEWSAWSDQTAAQFTRLPPGNYTFEVRSLSARGMLTPAAAVSFRIRPPLFMTWYAFGIYIILIFSFLALIRINHKKKQWKKQEQAMKEEFNQIKLRNEQAEAEIIKMANEKLSSEIALKNMELAKNTMSSIRKNKMLIKIKKELETLQGELKNRVAPDYFEQIYKLINNSINSEHDWEMFENLFDQAHHDFFKRLKQTYPELTPHDFRLCAYLRLNLSSKEIAPLLNISVRGVEEKRYRLRKKLNLQADQNLMDFILEF